MGKFTTFDTNESFLPTPSRPPGKAEIPPATGQNMRILADAAFLTAATTPHGLYTLYKLRRLRGQAFPGHPMVNPVAAPLYSLDEAPLARDVTDGPAPPTNDRARQIAGVPNPSGRISHCIHTPEKESV